MPRRWHQHLLRILSLGIIVLLIPTAALAQATCRDGLAGWWRGDGSAVDSATGSYAGALEGAAGYAPAVVNDGFGLAGGDVRIDYGIGLSAPASFTYDAWIQTTAGSFQYVLAWDECGAFCPSGARSLISLATLADGRPFVQIRQPLGPTVQSLVGPTSVSDGALHHIAMTRDLAAFTLNLYVDGALAATAPLTVSQPMDDDDGQNDPLRIGAASVSGSSTGYQLAFNGVIDEVAFYTRALSSSEIQAIHELGSAGRCDEFGPPPAPLPELSAGLLVGVGLAGIVAVAVAVRGRRG